MFQIEDFLAECRAARQEPDPQRAMRDVVGRAVNGREHLAAALRPREGGLTLLHRDPDLTVLHVVWSPRMGIYPHDHRMWAVIGIYGGAEDNRFFRRADAAAGTLIECGSQRLGAGDVAMLGPSTIHAVSNPRDRLTGAIHVYGGDFVDQPRSQWGPGEPVERPFDLAESQRQFADANARWQATGHGGVDDVSTGER